MQRNKRRKEGFRRRLLALIAAAAVFFVTVSGTLADAGVVPGTGVTAEAADTSGAEEENGLTGGSAENGETGTSDGSPENGEAGGTSADASAENDAEQVSEETRTAADLENNSAQSDRSAAPDSSTKDETSAADNEWEEPGTAPETNGGSTAAGTPAKKGYSASQTIKEDINGESRTLTVTARADAGVLPETAALKVTPVKENADNSQRYTEIKDKLEQNFVSENESLAGFLAYDISFENEGTEIEPSGSVTVSLSWDQSVRPEGASDADTVRVLHLKEDKSAPDQTEIVDLTENGENAAQAAAGGQSGASDAGENDTAAVLYADGTVTGGMDGKDAASDWTKDETRRKDTASENAENETAADSSVKETEMNVGSFSVFTITWTKSSSDKTRIGNVSMHYVDVNGLEIDRTAAINAGDLAKTSGGIVKIADWANNDTSNVRKVSGYVFQKAAIGSRDGTEITGLKVDAETTGEGASAKTTYKLYYTTSDAADLTGAGITWTPYTDGVSGNAAQNADIYLIFKSTAQRVAVHFVDESGNIIINPVYQYADKVTTDDTGVEVSTWAQTIQNYEFTGRAHMGETGWEGFAFKKIKAVTEGTDTGSTSTTYRFQYKLKSNDTNESWTDLTATDVYLIYRKTSGTKLITLHYIDRDGNALTDEAGNTLTKTIDAGDFVDGTWYNMPGLGDDVDGYARDDENSVTENGTKKTGGDGHGILVAKSGSTLAYDPNVSTGGGNNQNLWSKTIGTGNKAVTGYAFRYIQYITEGTGTSAHKVLKVAEGNKPGDDLSVKTGNFITRGVTTVTGDFDLYLVYKSATNAKTYKYTVHYVDEDGNEIPNSGTTVTNIAAAGSSDSVTVSLESVAKTISGYQAETVGYLGRATAATGGIPFTSITFTKQKSGNDYTGKWLYSVKNGESSEGSASKQLNLENLNFYVIYKAVKATDNARVIVHHVDEQGNTLHADTYPDGNGNWTISSTATQTRNKQTVLTYGNYWNGNSRTKDNNAFTKDSSGNVFTIDGYSVKDIYIGYIREANKYTNDDGTYKGGAIVWNYKTDSNGANGQWHTGYGTTGGTDTGTNPTVTEVYNAESKPELMTDIYVVYRKNTNLNIHYVYIGTGNTLSKIDNVSDKTNVTPRTKDSPAKLSSGDNVASITGKIYIGTRIGPSWKSGLTGADLGPNVTQVYAENGQLYYSFTNAADGNGTGAYDLTRQGSNDIWIYAAPSGRRFTLRKNGDNYTIGDSQHGTYDLNYTSENTWTATFHGEAETTEYTVTKSTTTQTAEGSGTTTTVDTYHLVLRDFIPNSLTDVYEMYIDDSSDAKVWINDDLKYSGYFTVGRNSWLETRMADGYKESDKISSCYYTWNRIVTGTATTDGTGDVSTTTSAVERKQTGIHWNIAYNRSDRTWLDIEADEGGLNETTQQAVSYTVTMHYRVGESGAWQEVTSEPVAVNYYSILMNGDFENLSILPGSKNYVAADKWGHYYSNATYKTTNRGVWQTTSPGTGGNVDADIEIINVKGTQDTTQATKTSYDWNTALPYVASHGDQFAELNAESAGALYQDVVTHPNQHLNYWLSHRARGQMPYLNGKAEADKASVPEYDTMYLVIMPTKLAMTSARDGGELKNQTDLEAFIDAHGGYDRVRATSVGQEITYKDETNGILIEKVTSNDQFWHKINVPNGYIAKAGLTRFFFVAGPTAWQNDTTDTDAGHIRTVTQERTNPTHGNFLDNVGFSQVLPDPDGFNLVVTKTFYNLSQAQIAGLVSGTGVTDDNKFKITITNKVTHSDGNNGWTEDSNSTQVNNSLEGAILSYTATETAGSYTFNLTATKGGTNLLTGSNTGDVLLNDDGSVTMTWTFVDQPLMSGGDQAHDQHYDYYAAETGADIANYSLTEATTVSPENANHKGAALVSEGSTAYFTFGNTYKSTTDSDQPRIIVTKKFFGLTPSAVDELFGDGYQVKVTNSHNETETLNTDPQTMSSNVTFEKSTDSGHNTTIRWTITGTNWGAGTYKISEEKFDTDEYTTSSIQIGTAAVTPASVTKSGSGSSATAGKENLTVGGDTGAASLTYDSEKTKSGSAGDNGQLTVGGNLSTETNLIIAKYITGDGANNTNYLVWTPDPVSASAAQAILNKINNPSTTDNGLGWTTSDAKATLSNTNFRSGDPGTISRSDASISYNNQTGALSFKNGSGISWKNFFSAKVSGMDTADLKVENHYDPAVRILKVDSTDNTHVLEGAQFKLYQLVQGIPESGQDDEGGRAKRNSGWNEENTEEQSLLGNVANVFVMDVEAAELLKEYYPASGTSWTLEETAGKTFTTNASGTVTLPELGQGTYYLTEVTTPSGFTKSIQKDIQFRVDENGTVHLYEEESEVTNNKNTDNVTLSWDKPYYTVTVPNNPTEIQIKKVSSENNNTLLGGASFRIFRMYTASGSSTAVKQYYHDSGSGAGWTTEESGAEVFTTASETKAATATTPATALGCVRLPDLYTGTYFLEELQAPDGYNKLSKPIAFNIDKAVTLPAADTDGKVDGVEVLNEKSGETSAAASIDDDTAATPKMYTITISNTPGVVLPDTGGSGRAMQIFLCGLLFLALDVIFLAMRRKGLY